MVRRWLIRIEEAFSRTTIFFWEDRRGCAILLVVLVAAIALRCTVGPSIGR